MWTYTKDEKLSRNDQFIEKIADAMLRYESQVFKLDNFDLLLIVQSISHLKRSHMLETNPALVSKMF